MFSTLRLGNGFLIGIGVENVRTINHFNTEKRGDTFRNRFPLSEHSRDSIAMHLLKTLTKVKFQVFCTQKAFVHSEWLNDHPGSWKVSGLPPLTGLKLWAMDPG